MWVSHDGDVLQHEAQVFNSVMRFVRLPEAAAAPYVRQLNDDWLSEFDVRESPAAAKHD